MRGFAVLASVLALVVFLPLRLCALELPQGEVMVLPVSPAALVAETAQGPHSFSVEIAATPQERAAGLMFRREMAPEHGMLFVFEYPQQAHFWMKNTILPLDIIFIREDGVVDSIGAGVPLRLDPVSSSGEILFVLELNAGMAGRYGIAPGTMIRHPVIGNVR